MRLIHTVCLHPLTTERRTIVSQPNDPTWPKDFVLAMPFCRLCHLFPPIEEIKKEESA